MEILEAILIAEQAIKLGDKLVTALRGYGKETISREEFEQLFILPDFNSFSKKATKEQEDNNNNE
jgi:hypothetical protein